MSGSMRRYLPLIAAIAGVIALVLVLPLYQPAQPRGIAITRGDARAIADRAAAQVGIPVERTFATLVWFPSPILVKELQANCEQIDRPHPR